MPILPHNKSCNFDFCQRICIANQYMLSLTLWWLSMWTFQSIGQILKSLNPLTRAAPAWRCDPHRGAIAPLRSGFVGVAMPTVPTPQWRHVIDLLSEDPMGEGRVRGQYQFKMDTAIINPQIPHTYFSLSSLTCDIHHPAKFWIN